MSVLSSPVGVGLRPTHYPHLLADESSPIRAGWFEAISENYMDSKGRPLDVLLKLRERFPIALHGVSMSVGSATGIDTGYLRRLRALIDRVDPFIVSDHLCWTGVEGENLHDLLPLPLTREAVDLLVTNIDRAQNALGRQMLFENVSVYLRSPEDEMSEQDFVVEVARRSGSKILLDVNNVYVNAVNHRIDAWAYLESVPPALIGQIHLGGPKDCGDFLFDTHSEAVPKPVWELLARLAPRISGVPVLVEWDEDVPEFPVLEAEAIKAMEILGG